MLGGGGGGGAIMQKMKRKRDGKGPDTMPDGIRKKKPNQPPKLLRGRHVRTQEKTGRGREREGKER